MSPVLINNQGKHSLNTTLKYTDNLSNPQKELPLWHLKLGTIMYQIEKI